MLLTDFKVLSFGCYGTLIDRDSGLYSALRPLLADARLKLGRAEALAAFVRHESAQQAETPGMPYSELLAQVHRRLARDWGVLCSEDHHTLFGNSVSNWPVFADAPAGLQYLRRYFKLAILSNTDRANFALSSRRLEVRFDAVFTAQEIGSCKPDPRNFEHLVNGLARLGLQRGDLLHTAGSLVRDHAPARACGLASAWIDRHRTDADDTVEVPDAVGYTFRFRSIADMVKAHQEQLRA